MMNEDSLLYENPLRTNYEARASAVWAASGVAAIGVNAVSNMPAAPMLAMCAIAGGMALARLPGAIRLHTLQKNFKGRELSFMTLDDLIKQIKERPDQVWYGHGFIWETRHAQRAFEILKRDWAQIDTSQQTKSQTKSMGQNWIHGIEPKETKIFQNEDHSGLHELVLGTTGSGKTRYFDLKTSQIIMRGADTGDFQSLFALDPKGDPEWIENARRAANASNPNRPFYVFDPADAKNSVRINPLANFGRVSELASRISSLLPSENANDPFTAFSWQAVNNIASALVMINERPSLVDLKSYLESGIHGVISRAFKQYIIDHVPNGEGSLLIDEWQRQYAGKESSHRAIEELIVIYTKRLEPIKRSSEVSALISMFLHDRAHASKMIAGLLPVMNMLTGGDLGPLLSPDYEDHEDERPIIDLQKVAREGGILMVKLDVLSDAVVGGAIGSLLLADLVSVAGDVANYGKHLPDDEKLTPMNIFIDEASSILSPAAIELLNKGRSAGARVSIASQEISSFAVRLGSKEAANMVLANCNTVVALRTLDPDTQKWLSESLPKTRVRHVMRTQGSNVSSDDPVHFSANTGERLMEEEADLFPPALWGMLPNLEYVAKMSGGTVVKGRIPILVENLSDAK